MNLLCQQPSTKLCVQLQFYDTASGQSISWAKTSPTATCWSTIQLLTWRRMGAIAKLEGNATSHANLQLSNSWMSVISCFVFFTESHPLVNLSLFMVSLMTFIIFWFTNAYNRILLEVRSPHKNFQAYSKIICRKLFSARVRRCSNTTPTRRLIQYWRFICSTTQTSTRF